MIELASGRKQVIDPSWNRKSPGSLPVGEPILPAINKIPPTRVSRRPKISSQRPVEDKSNILMVLHLRKSSLRLVRGFQPQVLIG
jgi:hypothetical protein